MLTGVFKDRTQARRGAAQSPEDLLAALLRAKSLRPHCFVRHCEIGPFVVTHACLKFAVLIELSRGGGIAAAKQQFLESLGYEILTFSHRDVMARPDAVLARIRDALK